MQLPPQPPALPLTLMMPLPSRLPARPRRSCFPLHSAERESGVLFEWIHLRVWPFIGIDGKRRRLMPDLGLMQQPIAEVTRAAELESPLFL